MKITNYDKISTLSNRAFNKSSLVEDTRQPESCWDKLLNYNRLEWNHKIPFNACFMNGQESHLTFNEAFIQML